MTIEASNSNATVRQSKHSDIHRNGKGHSPGPEHGAGTGVDFMSVLTGVGDDGSMTDNTNSSNLNATDWMVTLGASIPPVESGVPTNVAELTNVLTEPKTPGFSNESTIDWALVGDFQTERPMNSTGTDAPVFRTSSLAWSANNAISKNEEVKSTASLGDFKVSPSAVFIGRTVEEVQNRSPNLFVSNAYSSITPLTNVGAFEEGSTHLGSSVSMDVSNVVRTTPRHGEVATYEAMPEAAPIAVKFQDNNPTNRNGISAQLGAAIEESRSMGAGGLLAPPTPGQVTSDAGLQGSYLLNNGIPVGVVTTEDMLPNGRNSMALVGSTRSEPSDAMTLVLGFKPSEAAANVMPNLSAVSMELNGLQRESARVRANEKAAIADPMASTSAPALAPTGSPTADIPTVQDVYIAERVAYWVSNDVQKAELKLDGLGDQPVEVSIRLQGNEAHVAFRTDEPQARNALEHAGSQLRQMLQSEGLMLAGVSVGTTGAGSGQGQSDQRNRSNTRTGTVDVIAAAEPVRARPANLGVGRSLDLFV